MSPRAQIEALIAQLHQVKSRMPMYFHPVDGSTCLQFVHGMSTAAYALGVKVDRQEAWWKAQEARGWKRSSTGPVRQLERSGMNDAAAAEEILLIEIDTWQLLLNELPN